MAVSTVCIHDPVGEASPAADRTDAVRVVDAAAPWPPHCRRQPPLPWKPLGNRSSIQ